MTLYEFELNTEEKKRVEAIQVDLYEKMLGGSMSSDEGWEKYTSAFGEEVKVIYKKAAERTLKYYSEKPEGLFEALEAEVKNYVALICTIDNSRAKVGSKPINIEKWRTAFEKRISPYLKILNDFDAPKHEKLLNFILYAFEHREEFFKTEQKNSPLPFMLKIWQGTATNELAKITTPKNTSVDIFLNKTKIKKDDFEVALENFSKNSGIKTSTHKLLDIFMLAYAETGKKEVSISIQDFMKLRGLKDRKSAEEQVKDDLETLYSTSISFKQKEDGPKAGVVAQSAIRRGPGAGLYAGLLGAGGAVGGAVALAGGGQHTADRRFSGGGHTCD